MDILRRNNMIIDYIIVKGYTDKDERYGTSPLEKAVKEKLSDGYIPFGTLQIDPQRKAYAYQTMIKKGRAEEIESLDSFDDCEK